MTGGIGFTAPTCGLRMRLLDTHVRIQCSSADLALAIESRYADGIAAAVHVADTSTEIDLDIHVAHGRPHGLRVVDRCGTHEISATDEADMHEELDRSIVLGLQRSRPDLYVLHAAVLTRRRGALLLVGESGAGKSTMSWGLLHHGMRFMSDELAPVELATGTVLSFSRALCLKRDPPAGYPLPRAAVRIGSSIHVPTAALPLPAVVEPQIVRGVAFVRHDPGRALPEVREISPAEGAQRLYANALNALAHDARGLDAAIRLAARWPAVDIVSGDLAASCEAIVGWIDNVSARGC